MCGLIAGQANIKNQALSRGVVSTIASAALMSGVEVSACQPIQTQNKGLKMFGETSM